MPQRDPRVDASIGSAADFARPILTELRAAVHASCPSVEETIKWGHPHFLYHGMLCGMTAFKQHRAFEFWKEALLLDGAATDRGAATHPRRFEPGTRARSRRARCLCAAEPVRTARLHRMARGGQAS